MEMEVHSLPKLHRASENGCLKSSIGRKELNEIKKMKFREAGQELENIRPDPSKNR